MSAATYYKLEEELLAPDALIGLQRQKLAGMLREIVGRNRFYTAKLGGVAFDALVDPMGRLPFTTRQELEADQVANPPYGSNLTYPVAGYCRFFQTSGS